MPFDGRFVIGSPYEIHKCSVVPSRKWNVIQRYPSLLLNEPIQCLKFKRKERNRNRKNDEEEEEEEKKKKKKDEMKFSWKCYNVYL